MNLKKFVYSPGGENESGTSNVDDSSEAKKIEPETKEEATGEEKPILEKIKEALQDWSNKDEADQEFDDTRV